MVKLQVWIQRNTFTPIVATKSASRMMNIAGVSLKKMNEFMNDQIMTY